MKTAITFLLGVFVSVSADAAGLRTENFDVDPQWLTIGSGAGGNDFGYQTTSIAGGQPGEGGGRFTRSNFIRVYADDSVSLSLDDDFQASGKFDIGNVDAEPDFGPGFWLGFFDSGDAQGGAKIGIRFNNGGAGTGLSWTPGIATDPGGGSLFLPEITIAPSIDRTWEIQWDPEGGIEGAGQLQTTLSGPGGGTQTIDLTADLRGIGATLTGFGFNGSAGSSSDPGLFAEMFIDDVTYSVPEPSAFALAGLGLIPLLAYGWRQRRRQVGVL